MRTAFPTALSTLISIGLLATGASGQGIVRSYTVELEVSQVPPGGSPEFALGDRFTYGFTLDHDVNDTDPSSLGAFTLMAQTLVRDPSNVGTWDPAGGSLGPNQLRTRDNFFGQDLFEPVPDALGGFPAIVSGTETLDYLELRFGDSSQTGLTDTGSGQTLENLLGGAFDPANFPDNRQGLFVFTNRAVVLSVASASVVTAVPATGAATLLGFGLVLALAGAWLVRQRGASS